MTSRSKKVETTMLFKWLFHLVFWGIWFALPFMIIMNNPDLRALMIKLVPFNISLIPLFFINSEWLIMKMMPKRGINFYIISLFLLLATFMFLHLMAKSIFIDINIFTRGEIFRTFFPILTVGAVSTGYGLINYMIAQEKRKDEETEQRRQSELSFLRSQISPHFIFNALNSIVYLIRTKSREAEEVTIKLSEIMQYTLYKSPDHKVPLEKELDYLRNYIEIQKIRFGDDVPITFNVEGSSSNFQLEPMLIIPFVENAFKHGTGTVENPYIEIYIKTDQHQLKVLVKNRFHFVADNQKDQSGIGLKNVIRRLELLYPDKHFLSIKKEYDTFSVELCIEVH